MKERPTLAIGPIITTLVLVVAVVLGVLFAADMVERTAAEDRESARLAVNLTLSREMQSISEQQDTVRNIANELTRFLIDGLESVRVAMYISSS